MLFKKVYEQQIMHLAWKEIIFISLGVIIQILAAEFRSLSGRSDPSKLLTSHFMHMRKSKPMSLIFDVHIAWSRFIVVHRASLMALGERITCHAGDTREVGSLPRSGRSPGGGLSNPLQYSCLDSPMDRGAWRANSPKGRTQLSD